MLVALVMQGPPASGAAGAAAAGTAAAGGAYGTTRPAAAAPRLSAAALRRPTTTPSENTPGVSAADPGGEPASTASPSRAGSPQGEGRPRPGRPDSAVPDPFASDGVPVYTDRDPQHQQVRQPTGEGRRVDGDRARGAADPVGEPKASPSAQGTADGRDGADTGSAHDDGVDRKGPGRGGTARKKAAGSGTVGDTSAAPDKWRAQPARNVRDKAGSAARAPAPRQAAAESTFRPLPFGTGLILIGLGLGFLGVRLRRS